MNKMSQQENQPVVKKTSAWMLALKQWNQNQEKGKQWCVPKRDTPEHAEVLKIANQIKALLPESEKKVKQAKRKPDNRMIVEMIPDTVPQVVFVDDDEPVPDVVFDDDEPVKKVVRKKATVVKNKTVRKKKANNTEEVATI